MNATTSDPRFDFVSLGESMLRLTVPTRRRLEDTRSTWSLREQKARRLCVKPHPQYYARRAPENVVAMFEVVDEYR
jgi:hypothetical protein